MGSLRISPTEVVALKHTPGPFMVKAAGSQDEIWADRGLVAQVPLCFSGSRQARADANLFSAAPDLLLAMKIRVAFEAGQNPFGHDCILGCIACMDRLEAMEAAAIAKAEPQ